MLVVLPIRRVTFSVDWIGRHFRRKINTFIIVVINGDASLCDGGDFHKCWFASNKLHS